MSRDHSTLVDRQFGTQAEAYVTSAVHASGPDLDWMEDIVRTSGSAEALDLGCGGGHVAYRAGPHVARVTACDLSAEMLAAVSRTSAERGLANIATVEARAENLPFADDSFDIVLSRFSAHHWTKVEAGLAEARRVLKPGRPFVLVDAVAPGCPLRDTHLQAVEALRDPSHVRDYSPAEWLAMLARAGFTVRQARSHRLRMDFSTWTQRMRTPDTAVAAIRYLQNALPEQAARAFAIEADGSFLLDTLWIEAA